LKASKQYLHEVHGGGAWKVAYADFVTALMALFMVLWISAQDEEILLSTSRYFQNPFSYALENKSSGIMKEGYKNFSKGSGNNMSMVDMNFLHSLATEFMRLMDVDESDPNAPIQVNVTSDGLRITVYDRGDRPIFKKYTEKLTDWGDFVLQNLAWLMDRYDFRVRVDSHVPVFNTEVPEDYDPWGLTANRSNVARKTLVDYALHERKMDRITGYGDAHPLSDKSPSDESNQRVEFSLAVK